MGKAKGIGDMKNKPHILLIHGIFNTGRCFNAMRRYFEKQGYVVHSPSLKPSWGFAELRDLSELVTVYINEEIPNDVPIHAIGYSMGGLVLRYHLQQQNCLNRYLSFTTISSPHNGTHNAWLLPLDGVKDMRQQSEFIENLEKEDHRIADHCKPLSLWTPLDLIILPQNSSEWSIAQNEKYLVSMHPAMIRSPKIIRRISEHLTDSEFARLEKDVA